MEKAEISRLINSFNAIKGYFDTTKRYMPQIAKLVFFIEEIVPLLNTIHDSLHQSSTLIPSATEKLGKVTSATEMAATEVMNIVDNVINRLNTMSDSLDAIEQKSEEGIDAEFLKEKTSLMREEIDGSQDDLFSIMNALQFQDITTQQINSIASTIEAVYVKLAELLQGFEDENFNVDLIKNVSFDPNAEFDFNRSADSQKFVDDLMKQGINNIDIDEIRKQEEPSPATAQSEMTPASAEEPDSNDVDEIVFGEDGQPDISSIMNQLNAKKKPE